MLNPVGGPWSSHAIRRGKYKGNLEPLLPVLESKHGNTTSPANRMMHAAMCVCRFSCRPIGTVCLGKHDKYFTCLHILRDPLPLYGCLVCQNDLPSFIPTKTGPVYLGTYDPYTPFSFCQPLLSSGLNVYFPQFFSSSIIFKRLFFHHPVCTELLYWVVSNHSWYL